MASGAVPFSDSHNVALNVLCLLEMRQGLAALPLAPELQQEIALILLDHESGAPLLAAAIEIFRGLDLQARVDALLYY